MATPNRLHLIYYNSLTDYITGTHSGVAVTQLDNITT